MVFQILIILLTCGITRAFTVDDVQKYVGCMSQCQQASCRDECFQNEYSDKKMKTSTEAANFNATLHCKDVDLLAIKYNPGIYVIAMENMSNVWSRVSMVEGGHSIFQNLLPGTSYRLVVHRFKENVISAPEITEWFTTTALGMIPEPLAGVHMKQILKDDRNDDHLMAEISLLPGEDRSCFYDVLSFHADEGLSIGSLNGTRGFQFKLRNLEYHQNNTVMISARNNGSSKSSRNISLTFETPTCLEIHANLSRCPPDEVSGLKMTGEHVSDSEVDFSLSWDQPKFPPNNYRIQITTIDQSTAPYVIIVPGNETGVSYSLENIGIPHMITIVAESLSGTSMPVTIPYVPEPERYSSTSVLQKALIIFPAVILGAVFTTMIYIYLRNRKIQNWRDPYRYCKNNFHDRTIFNHLYEKPKVLEVEYKTEDDPLIAKDHLELGAMPLQIKCILGSGFSGVVRLGTLKIDESKTIDVAVKMLRDCPSPEDVKNFQHEMMVMRSAGKHPNIVSLIGCCTSEIKPLLVVEYCSKGDLQTYLRNIWKSLIEGSLHCEAKCKLINERSRALPSPEYENNQETVVSNMLYDMQQDVLNATEDITGADLLRFAMQIANGMKFLSLNRIVHRDLAARNVLVCGDRTVKISDFGLSRDIYQDSVYKKQGDGKLPLKWMAVEALTHQIYTSQSDVWSFGILLWEIVTLGCNPYPDTPTHTILQVLKTGYRMERPSNCGKELYDIMLSCWRTRPRSRPTFTDLKRDLEKLLQTVGHHEYLNLYDIHNESRNTDTSE